MVLNLQLEREKFEKIYIKYLDNLYNMALRLTRNPDDAEDLVAETSLRAFRFFYQFKKGTSIRSWLYKIMHNLFINKYRKKKKEPKVLELKEEILIKEDTSQDFFSKLLEPEIEDALESLPEEFRKAVILSDLDGFNYKEISEILDCPLGTVRSRLSRARKMLFAKLYNFAQSRGFLKK